MPRKMNTKRSIYNQFSSNTGQIAVLIDPEKTNNEAELIALVEKSVFAGVAYFFIGGSTVARSDFEKTTALLKKHSSIPIVIFPGGNTQLSSDADAILYLSLLSGRNPEYLIGQHVTSANEVLQLGLEVIPTSYILVDGGTKSSVAYVSQTTPIPLHQKSIAVNTAIAGYLQGKKITYFDAGSGAKTTVPTSFVQSLKAKIDTITIVGGGIQSIEEIDALRQAGANVIVIGNKIESDIDFLLDLKKVTSKGSH